MAKDTLINLRNQVMYCVYVRNYGPNGTFKDVENDLNRIKDLGTDIIWFMPIHPIGVEGRKGSLGCPYSIKDYRKVNPEYGTMNDFKNLVAKIHDAGMKCIIDVVYNHTSKDSALLAEHPEYFYRKEDGTIGGKVGDWTDVVDLEYENRNLWKYQIDTLKMLAGIVDGFRCDVAPLVPIDFWIKARAEVKKVNSDCIWLAETLNFDFIKYLRSRGLNCASDGEVYQAFDICYEYDIWDSFNKYLKGECTLSHYIDRLNMQESIYPQNYVKLRYLENHDQPRAKKIIPDTQDLRNWLAFTYFQKGTTLIYAGQEAQNTNCPSLFEIDKVDWSGIDEDFTSLMKKLYNVKKFSLVKDGDYKLVPFNELDAVTGYYEKNNSKLVGVFSLKGKQGLIKIELKDGVYTNILNNKTIEVKNGCIDLEDEPVIININD